MQNNATTITLKAPVNVTLKKPGGEERQEVITEVTIQPFKAKHLRALDGLPDDARGSMLIKLIAALTDQPLRVIEELGSADFESIAEAIGPFLPTFLETGARS